MKKFILIELSEIDSRIKELGHLMKIADDDQALEEFSNKRDECFNLKSKGKIVEIEDNLQAYYDNMENSPEGKEYNAWKFTKLKEGYTFCDFLKDYHNKKGFKLIKTIKQ